MSEYNLSQQVPFPKHLLIETTTKCNLRCKQCARLVDKYALADMAMDAFQRLAPLFPYLKEVALYGHGETFLYKHLFEMLEELKRHNIFVYITTNGTLITEEVAKRLVELQLDRLSFSLDAATPELFNEIRRGADFDKIIDNIHTLNAYKKRLHRDDKPALSLMYCAMKSNIQELPKLIRLADQLNMTDGVSVMNIYEYEQTDGENILRYPELLNQYVNEACELATKLAVPLNFEESFPKQFSPVHITGRERIYRNYREFQRSFDRTRLFKTKLSRVGQKIQGLFNNNNHHQPSEESSPSPSAKTIRVKKCRDPWDFMFVNVHGEVRVCCGSHQIMGNVNDEDILSIWNGKPYQEFRERILTEDPPEDCKTCLLKGWHEIPVDDLPSDEGV